MANLELDYIKKKNEEELRHQKELKEIESKKKSNF